MYEYLFLIFFIGYIEDLNTILTALLLYQICIVEFGCKFMGNYKFVRVSHFIYNQQYFFLFLIGYFAASMPDQCRYAYESGRYQME